MHDDRFEEALTESTIDREIEIALAIDPSPEFMARVRARIASESAPTMWRLSWVPTAAGAAVGIIVIVVAISRSGRQPRSTSADPWPTSATPSGDVSLEPMPSPVWRGGSTVAAPPLRRLKAGSGFNGAARPDSVLQQTKPSVPLATDEVASGGARPNEVATIPSGPLRVGGNIKAPRKIVDVKPVYPDEARATRASGAVVLEVSIATDGSVSNARVVRSAPMFDQSAIDAVRQWKFEPTLLDGAPVDVQMNVFINFTPE